MNSSQYKKNELKKLCSLIGSTPDEIVHITNNIDSYYNEWTELKKNKSTGAPKTYKDGTIKKRIISPPTDRLYVLQKKIKSKILAPIILPENIHGGVKRKSSITNSLPHKGKKYHFTTDLQDFFPNISNKQVYSAFETMKYSPHFCYWIAKLTTWKYKVPQGAPTSSHIANLVFLSTDYKLIQLCKEYNITYTRYVDDLTFSSPVDFKAVLNKILNIIVEDGFKISYRKTEYHGKKVLVTGIEIHNNYIDAPEKIKVEAELEKLSNNTIKPYTIYLESIRKQNLS